MMRDVCVRETVIDDIATMLGHLRYEDHKDCWYAGKMTADDALVMSYRKSAVCYTIVMNGTPAACFGAAPLTMLDIKGVPWLLGTDAIRKIGLTGARLSRQYIKVLLDRFEVLENWVDANNEVSLRWLKFCGFHIQPEPEPYGWALHPFHRCWIRRG